MTEPAFAQSGYAQSGGVVDFTATVNPVLNRSDRKPMEQIKRNYFGGANFEARTVKDIIAPAKSISNKVSVRAL